MSSAPSRPPASQKLLRAYIVRDLDLRRVLTDGDGWSQAGGLRFHCPSKTRDAGECDGRPAASD